MALASMALAQAAAAQAQGTPAGRGGKLLLTGGVSSIDGAAGGGLTPWAVTGGYATQDQWGATAHATPDLPSRWTRNDFPATLPACTSRNGSSVTRFLSASHKPFAMARI